MYCIWILLALTVAMPAGATTFTVNSEANVPGGAVELSNDVIFFDSYETL